MSLYHLPAKNSQSLFGTPDAPTPKADLTIIAQTPDCSSFLVLSNTAYPELTPFTSFDGYDFTYCQEWGLTVNDEVVHRVWEDIRAKSYPPITDYLDAIVKQNVAQAQKYIDACLAVKDKYPKEMV
jgi:hypothetical protein